LAHREGATLLAGLRIDAGRPLVLERVPVAAATGVGQVLVVAVLAVVDHAVGAAILERRRGGGRRAAADGGGGAGGGARRRFFGDDARAGGERAAEENEGKSFGFGVHRRFLVRVGG